MPRMNILNTVEREAFNSPPVFSSFQRKQYFDFPSKLRRFAAGLRNLSTVFSAAERESAYVIDGLMHNEVVKSDIHSTSPDCSGLSPADAFGFSELVFAVSHLLGFSYAPRFKNLPRQRLYTSGTARG